MPSLGGFSSSSTGFFGGQSLLLLRHTLVASVEATKAQPHDSDPLSLSLSSRLAYTPLQSVFSFFFKNSLPFPFLLEFVFPYIVEMSYILYYLPII